jgi:hypothetical protein
MSEITDDKVDVEELYWKSEKKLWLITIPTQEERFELSRCYKPEKELCFEASVHLRRWISANLAGFW